MSNTALKKQYGEYASITYALNEVRTFLNSHLGNTACLATYKNATNRLKIKIQSALGEQAVVCVFYKEPFMREAPDRLELNHLETLRVIGAIQEDLVHDGLMEYMYVKCNQSVVSFMNPNP